MESSSFLPPVITPVFTLSLLRVWLLLNLIIPTVWCRKPREVPFLAAFPTGPFRHSFSLASCPTNGPGYPAKSFEHLCVSIRTYAASVISSQAPISFIFSESQCDCEKKDSGDPCLRIWMEKAAQLFTWATKLLDLFILQWEGDRLCSL